MTTSRPLHIGVVAGEASGDLLGSKLISLLRAFHPNIHFSGMGGRAMMAAGCDSLYDMEQLSMMGFIEPLLRLPSLIRLRRNLYRHFTTNRPDIFIGIDAPDFNLGLEYRLRAVGIPTVHYVSPSVWAWRRYRVKKIAKSVDLMLVLLPFEAAFYEKHQVPVQYIGHPLADLVSLEPDTTAARLALCIEEQGPYIALLPGSRKQEIKYMAQPFLEAAQLVWQRNPKIKFITPQVNAERYHQFYSAYQTYAPKLPLQFFTCRTQDVIAAADAVLVTSGTATLETMLYKKPMVIAYGMSSLTYQLAKRLVKVPYVGLPNLLAQDFVVPEFIQDAVVPQKLADLLLRYLDHPDEFAELKTLFTTLHQSLKPIEPAFVAESILKLSKNALHAFKKN